MPFRDVVGHPRLVQLLSRSAAGGTLPPSLLFAGPSGIGKRLIAVAVAQALNCLTNRNAQIPNPESQLDKRLPNPESRPDKRIPNPEARIPSSDACGTCAACTRIARGMHPDVLIVEPGDSGSIKIDQVRDII